MSDRYRVALGERFIGDLESYGSPYFEEDGTKYYDPAEYTKAHTKGHGKKKAKKTADNIGGLNFSSLNSLAPVAEEDYEDERPQDEEKELEDLEKKEEKKRKDAEEKFLAPDFIAHEIPKATMATMEKPPMNQQLCFGQPQKPMSVQDAQYIVFNGAQTRVRYIVVLGENEKKGVFGKPGAAAGKEEDEE